MRILIADDHPLYREAIRGRLERSYPGAEILEISDMSDPMDFNEPRLLGLDLVLLDYHMPGISGHLEIQQIIAQFNNTPTILISGMARREDVKAAISAGARGFMAKTMPAKQFDDALSIVLDGGTYLPADMIFAPAEEAFGGFDRDEHKKALAQISQLTPREREILSALGGGASNKEIGRHFDLAEITVKLHLRQIFKKMAIKNRSEAAVIAAKAGLI